MVVSSVNGGTLVIGVDQEPPTLDPHASPSAITFYITSSTHESLLYLSDDRSLKPWLAESYEVSDGGKAFTFKLRRDVTFQDGTPFNASAVKWNFDRIVDPNFKAGGALASLAGYDGTDVVDDYTVRVRFKAPYAPFLNYVGGPTLAMLSPQATQQQGDRVNQTPVGSGPYKIDEWVAKDRVVVSRWDGYTRRLPWADQDGPGNLERVTWRFIPENATRITTVESGESGMVNVLTAQDLPRLRNSGNISIVSKPWVGAPLFMAINVQKPPNDDLKVSQAINYAIDREAIVNLLYNGVGVKASAPLTAALLDDPSLQSYYPFDQARARALLEEAGWTLGVDGVRTKGGQRLAIVLNAIDYGGGTDQYFQFVQGQLREVGFDATIKAQARAPWYEDTTTAGPT